jgi:hypothetical protein
MAQGTARSTEFDWPRYNRSRCRRTGLDLARRNDERRSSVACVTNRPGTLGGRAARGFKPRAVIGVGVAALGFTGEPETQVAPG